MSEDAIAVFIPIVAIIVSLSIPIVFAIIEYRRRRDIVRRISAFVRVPNDETPAQLDCANGRNEYSGRDAL